MRFDSENPKTWPKTEGPWLVRCMGDLRGDTINAWTWESDIKGGDPSIGWALSEVVEYLPLPTEDKDGNWPEDPHGWVSVSKKQPTPGQKVEVWTDRGGQMFRLWSAALIGLVTHWRVPTPGPQTSTGGES